MQTTAMTTSQARIRGAVRNGVALLDARMPDWYTHIDLDILQMQFGCNCVLGQLHRGHYALGTSRLRLGATAYNPDAYVYMGMAVDLGFHARNHAEWDALTEEWTRVIKARRLS